MITNLMEIYKIVNYGEEVVMTDVRWDAEEHVHRIIRKTCYRYHGVTYRPATGPNHELQMVPV